MFRIGEPTPALPVQRHLARRGRWRKRFVIANVGLIWAICRGDEGRTADRPLRSPVHAAQGAHGLFFAEHDLDKIVGFKAAPCRLFGKVEHKETCNSILRLPCFPRRCSQRLCSRPISRAAMPVTAKSRAATSPAGASRCARRPRSMPKLGEGRNQPRRADRRRERRHHLADGDRQVERRQGAEGRAERQAEGDRQGRCSTRRPEAARPTRPPARARSRIRLSRRRRSRAQGVRRRRPHPDRQHQDLSVQRHRVPRSRRTARANTRAARRR